MLHASSDQSGAHISIKLGYLDLIQIAVDPVEFSSDPVHGQALRGGQTVLHNHFNSCHPWNNNTNNTVNREAVATARHRETNPLHQNTVRKSEASFHAVEVYYFFIGSPKINF